MISTGGTLVAAVQTVLAHGALSPVTVVASHGLFAGPGAGAPGRAAAGAGGGDRQRALLGQGALPAGVRALGARAGGRDSAVGRLVVSRVESRPHDHQRRGRSDRRRSAGPGSPGREVRRLRLLHVVPRHHPAPLERRHLRARGRERLRGGAAVHAALAVPRLVGLPLGARVHADGGDPEPGRRQGRHRGGDGGARRRRATPQGLPPVQIK